MTSIIPAKPYDVGREMQIRSGDKQKLEKSDLKGVSIGYKDNVLDDSGKKTIEGAIKWACKETTGRSISKLTDLKPGELTKILQYLANESAKGGGYKDAEGNVWQGIILNINGKRFFIPAEGVKTEAEKPKKAPEKTPVGGAKPAEQKEVEKKPEMDRDNDFIQSAPPRRSYYEPPVDSRLRENIQQYNDLQREYDQLLAKYNNYYSSYRAGDEDSWIDLKYAFSSLDLKYNSLEVRYEIISKEWDVDSSALEEIKRGFSDRMAGFRTLKNLFFQKEAERSGSRSSGSSKSGSASSSQRSNSGGFKPSDEPEGWDNFGDWVNKNI